MSLQRLADPAAGHHSIYSVNRFYFTHRRCLCRTGGGPTRPFPRDRSSEQRATRRHQNERIDRDHVGPHSRKGHQSLFLVVEVDEILAPRILVCDQLKRLTAPRMKRMSDSECLRRNVGLRAVVNVGQRLCGEFQWEIAGRMPECELVSESERCQAEDRELARGVQRRAATQQPGVSNAGGICEDLL
jgi:hypothetical protein